MRSTSSRAATDRYLDLVRALPLRRINSATEHARATTMYLRLSSRRADRATRDYLDVLADLIAEYERRSSLVIDTSGVSAADLVRHRLEERGMSISEAARRIGVSQPNLSEMLSGKRDWSKAAIRGLVREFHMRAERFL